MMKLIRRLTCVFMVLVLLTGSAAFAEEPVKEITVGSLTQLDGNFFTNCWSNNTADYDVRELIHGYSTVTMHTDGYYGVDESVTMAETYSDDNGNTVYEFTLKENLKWSDGTPVTAQDYVFTLLLLSSSEFQALGANAMTYSYLVGQADYLNGTADIFAGVHLIDEYKFSLTISAEYLPNFYELMLARVTPSPMHVIAPNCEVADDGEGAYIKAVENTDGAFTTEVLNATLLDPETGYCTHPDVVCGPYKLVSYEDHVAVFEKNEYYNGNYGGQKGYYDKITFKQVFNDTMMDELKNGTVDLVNKVSSAALIDSARATDGLKTQSYDREGFAFLAFACENEPVSSANVRKAINHLVDTDTLIAGYLGGYGENVYGYYGVGQWMVDEIGTDVLEEKLNLYAYDVDAAIELLEADGWTLEEGADIRTKDGTQLVIHWVRPEVSEIADGIEALITDSFAQAGIGLEVTKMSFEDLLKYYYRQEDRSEYDMFFLANNFGLTFDAYPAVSTAEEYQGVNNTTAIADEELEALALDMNKTRSYLTSEYEQKWLKFQEKWVEDLPMVPLYTNKYVDVFDSSIKNYHPRMRYSWAFAILYAYE